MQKTGKNANKSRSNIGDAEAVLLGLAARLHDDHFWGQGLQGLPGLGAGGGTDQSEVVSSDAAAESLLPLQTSADREAFTRALQAAVRAGRETPASLAAKTLALISGALHQFDAAAVDDNGTCGGLGNLKKEANNKCNNFV